MTAKILIAQSDAEINECFDAFCELRPHLVQAEFLLQVRRQQAQGYQIVTLREGPKVVAIAGFRDMEFMAWGKVIYIDDLCTLPCARAKGYAGRLLDWLIELAKSQGYRGVHLDSGYGRQNAHRLYLNKRLQLSCHHFALEFIEP